MGVYSQYAASVAESSVGFADESYAGVAGAYRMMEESAINSHSIFEAVIGRDYVEAYNAINPSIVSESDLEAVNEASIGEIWNKVIAFIQKLWQKILGILKSIKDRVAAVFVRDGKELVNKYKKDILKKVTNGDFTDKFKFKWKNTKGKRAEIKDLASTLEGVLKKSRAGSELAINLRIAEKQVGKHETNSDDDLTANTAKGREAIAKINNTSEDTGYRHIRPYTSDELTDYTEETLGAILGVNSVSKSDFAKEFHDAWFDDPDEVDNFSGKMDEIIETLTTAKDSFNKLSKAETTVNNAFKEDRKKAQNIQKEMSKLAGKEENTTHAAYANRKASRAIAALNIISTCTTLTISAWTACFKEEVKQARAVWIKAATWRKTATTESTLLEAVEQVSDFEVEQMFDFV